MSVISPYTRQNPHGFRFLDISQTSDGSDPPDKWVSHSWVDTFSGSSLPRYRHQIMQHNNATTTASGTKYKVEVKHAAVAFTATATASPTAFPLKANASGLTCSFFLPFTPGVVQAGNADNDAAGDFYKHVRNAMSAFKGSTFAAEAREAQQMMWTRATSMIAMISPYQRRLKRRWKGKGTKRSRAKLLSDSWLELQFGWLPLSSDIQDACKALNEPVPQYKRVKGTGLHGEEVSKTSSITQQGGTLEIHRETRESTQYKVKYYGEIQARRDPNGSTVQDFGLGVREFFPTVWEVIPWSFAVDYFTNVGDIITALSYASTDLRWAGKSVQQSRTKTRSATHGIYSGLFNRRELVNIPSSFKGEATSFARVPVESVPIPSLRWQLPSWRQGLNLAALAVSRRLRLYHP